MRINKLHTICMMTLSAILFVGLEASAQFDMEAGAGCIDEACMFGGQTLAQNTGVAQLHKINIFSVDGKDPREQFDRASEAVRQLMPIGTITNNSPITVTSKKTGLTQTGIGTGTAFMISPCYAMTNRHVVYGDQVNIDDSKDHSMTINLGAGAQGGFAHSVKAKVVKRGKISENIGHDFAVLRLEECVGEQVGWMDIVPVKNPAAFIGKVVSLAGYPGDRSAAKLSVQHNCQIKDIDMTLDLFQHNCANRQGASGSPMYVMVNGVPTVVAINSGEMSGTEQVLSSYDSKRANVAVTTRFLEDFPEILAAVKKDIDRSKVSNPAASAKRAIVKSEAV